MKTIFWSRISFVIEDKVVTVFPSPYAPINTINCESVRIFKYGCQNSAKKYFNNCSWIVVFDFRVSNPHSPICRPKLWPGFSQQNQTKRRQPCLFTLISIYLNFVSYNNPLQNFWKILLKKIVKSFLKNCVFFDLIFHE